MANKQYAAADLQVGTTATFQIDNGITTHIHLIRFGRPLTRAEQHLFVDVLVGFYHTSRQFGDFLVTEPVVEFLNESEARDTLRQRNLSGEWKDLLFTILAKVSHEIAPIQCHDDSRIFDPVYAQHPA